MHIIGRKILVVYVSAPHKDFCKALKTLYLTSYFDFFKSLFTRESG